MTEKTSSLKPQQYEIDAYAQAAKTGDMKLVSEFLNKFGDEYVDAVSSSKWTALMLTAFRGNREMALFLLEHGADVNKKDNAGYSAITWAETLKKRELLDLFYDWPEMKKKNQEKRKGVVARESQVERLKQLKPKSPFSAKQGK